MGDVTDIIIVIIIVFLIFLISRPMERYGCNGKPIGDGFVADFPITDKDYPKRLLKGEYGGVPLYFYDFEDDLYHDQWRGFATGSYVLNSKKQWLKTDVPREYALWVQQMGPAPAAGTAALTR